MHELKLVLWRLGSGHIPRALNEVRALDIDFASHPNLVTHLADGWHVISHTLSGLDGGDLLLTLFLERTVTAPESTAGL